MDNEKIGNYQLRRAGIEDGHGDCQNLRDYLGKIGKTIRTSAPKIWLIEKTKQAMQN